MPDDWMVDCRRDSSPACRIAVYTCCAAPDVTGQRSAGDSAFFSGNSPLSLRPQTIHCQTLHQAQKETNQKQTSSSKKKKQKQTDTERRSLSEWFDLLHDACSSICKGLRCLTKRIRFRHVSIYIGVGNWDAAECAAEYAKLNTALYPCLAVLGTVCSVAYDGIDVRCCFGQNRTRYYLSGTVRLSLAGVLAAAFAFLFSFLWNTLERKQAPRNSPERLFRIFPLLLHTLFSYTQILHIGGFSHARIQFQTL